MQHLPYKTAINPSDFFRVSLKSYRKNVIGRWKKDEEKNDGTTSHKKKYC